MINDTTYATVDEAPPSGLAWRAKHIYRVPPAVNRGKRNVFVSVYRAGQMVRDGSIYIEWGWNGKGANEVALPVPCNKQEADYCADIPIFKGQEIWVRVLDGKGTPSDKVSGIRSDMPSDGEGDYEFHNSTAVTFEITIIAPPVIDNPPTAPSDDDRKALIAIREILRGRGL
jgi:hypothetical protein